MDRKVARLIKDTLPWFLAPGSQENLYTWLFCAASHVRIPANSCVQSRPPTARGGPDKSHQSCVHCRRWSRRVDSRGHDGPCRRKGDPHRAVRGPAIDAIGQLRSTHSPPHPDMARTRHGGRDHRSPCSELESCVSPKRGTSSAVSLGSVTGWKSPIRR
jgi:hypothetical protein